jgi:glutathione S-transferase
MLIGSTTTTQKIITPTLQKSCWSYEMIEYLLENSKYLNGDQISIADFSASANLSILDYFGDINWHHHSNIKEWYVLLKSHRFFADILTDRITNILPPVYYSQLDF